jgi:glutathione S-transferase
VDIIYRDTSTHYPRRVRSVEASLGHFSARGKNKSEAKAALLAQVADHAEHLGERRYLIGPKATFALTYVAGWQYDIIPMDASTKPARFSTTMSGSEETLREAFERMERHFRQYHGFPEEES